ncbi:MAG: hypothetical protein AAB327_07890, partial [Actinomycetota bacterium]
NDVATGAVSAASASVIPTASSTTTTITAPTTTGMTISSTSTTSTTIPSIATPSTTTSSSLPTLSGEQITVRAIPGLVLQPFASYSTSLDAQQRQLLTKYGALLRRGDKVTCVGYAVRNSRQLVSTLSVKRAKSVCVYLARQVRGITTTVGTQLPTTIGTGSVSALTPLPPNLARRVVVLAASRS